MFIFLCPHRQPPAPHRGSWYSYPQQTRTGTWYEIADAMSTTTTAAATTTRSSRSTCDPLVRQSGRRDGQSDKQAEASNWAHSYGFSNCLSAWALRPCSLMSFPHAMHLLAQSCLLLLLLCGGFMLQINFAFISFRLCSHLHTKWKSVNLSWATPIVSLDVPA